MGTFLATFCLVFYFYFHLIRHVQNMFCFRYLKVSKVFWWSCFGLSNRALIYIFCHFLGLFWQLLEIGRFFQSSVHRGTRQSTNIWWTHCWRCVQKERALKTYSDLVKLKIWTISNFMWHNRDIFCLSKHLMDILERIDALVVKELVNFCNYIRWCCKLAILSW